MRNGRSASLQRTFKKSFASFSHSTRNKTRDGLIRVRNIRALNGRFNTSITHAYSIVIGSKHITLNATGGGFLTASKQFRHGATSKDRKSGSAGMPRPSSYAVFCLKKKTRRQPRLLRERAVREAGLAHQPLDGRTERVVAETTLARHQPSISRTLETSSPTLTALSSPFMRSRRSTVPSSAALRPTVTRTGHPIRSASANFSPARASRSSTSTSKPAAASGATAASACSSKPDRTTTCTSYGATEP